MSNKGRSPLRPTRNERDAVVQVWVDRKDLATIGLYMETKGIRLVHMSDILGFCVEVVKTIILKANGTYVSSTAEASAFLESRFKAKLNPRGRGNKNLITNLLGDGNVDDIEDVVIRPSITPALIASLKEKAIEAQKEKENPNDTLLTRAERDSSFFDDQSRTFADIAKANLDVVEDE